MSEIRYEAPKVKRIEWVKLEEICSKQMERIGRADPLLTWELKLEKRIRDAGYKCSAFDGITSHDERKAYFRSIINMHDLRDKPCGKTTFAGAFEMTYREQL